MTPDRKTTTAAIRTLIRETRGRLESLRPKSSYLTEVTARAGEAAMPLESVGLHLQVSTWGQWIVYLSVTLRRTDTAYGGMAFCHIHTSDSLGRLVRWLSARATAGSLYQEVCGLTKSYLGNMWLDGETPLPPLDAGGVCYETWYQELAFDDPLCYVERTDTLAKAIRNYIRANRTIKFDVPSTKYGEYYSYVLGPGDVARRKEYILRHNERLRRSAENLTPPILSDMQQVCFEICALARDEFDPDKDINEWSDPRYTAGVQVTRINWPGYEAKGEPPGIRYYCSIRLQVPDGLCRYVQCRCDSATEVRNWLDHYSRHQWVAGSFTRDAYVPCLDYAYLEMPDVY